MKNSSKVIATQALEDIVELADSGTWGDDGKHGSDSPVLRSTNIAENRLSFSDPAWRIIPTNDLVRRKLATGDIIVTKSSGSPDHIGKCAIFEDPADGNSYYFSNFMLRLRVNQGQADPRWLYYWLTSDNGRFIMQQMNSTTTGLRNLSVGQYLKQQMPMPRLPEQRRIADILDKADSIRRKRKEAVRNLNTYPHSLFLEMFGHPDSNDNLWPRLLFSEVCDSRLGKMLDAKHQTGKDRRPYMRNLNVQWGRLDMSSVFEMDFDQRDRSLFRLQYGDVLICEGGAGVGQTAIWKDELPECYFQKSLHRARPYPDKATPEYIAYLMWTLMKGSSFFRSISSATIPHLTGEKLKVVPIPVPPIKLQKQFQVRCEKYKQSLCRQHNSASATDELFNALVQQAFSGNL